MNITPIGKPSPNWSRRKLTITKGHTESFCLVKMGKEIDTAQYHDVLRIHKPTPISPRRGVVHEKIYNHNLMKDELVSHEVVEVKCGKAKYWKKVL